MCCPVCTDQSPGEQSGPAWRHGDAIEDVWMGFAAPPVPPISSRTQGIIVGCPQGIVGRGIKSGGRALCPTGLDVYGRQLERSNPRLQQEDWVVP